MPRRASQLNRPPIGHLAQIECPEHLVARSPEWPEICQRDAVQPPNQGGREAVTEHGVPRHRAGQEMSRKPRSEDNVRATFADRVDQAAKFTRSVAVVSIEEHDNVWVVRGCEPGQACTTISAPSLDDDARASCGCDIACAVSRVRIDDQHFGDEEAGMSSRTRAIALASL